MKAVGFLFLVLTFFSVKAFPQGTGRFEIWGLTKHTKEEFIELYKQTTNKDLNYTYTCASDLEKMGFHDSQSQLWVDDIDKFLSGKLNWDTTERLAIIRPVPSNQYNTYISDSLNQKALEPKITDLIDKDTLSIEKYLINNKDVLNRLLMGLSSKNRNFRENCKKIILSAPKLSLEETPDNIDLLNSLLSVPDIDVCYASINLIRNSNWSESVNKKLFASGAVTLIDFLQSNLRTFRIDAITFLTDRVKGDRNAEQEYLYWIAWIKSQK